MNFETRLRPARPAATLIGIAALVACTTPPAPVAAPPTSTVAPAPKPVLPNKPLPPAPAPLPAAPPVSLTPAEMQKSLLAAIEMLEMGQEELAEAELQKMVQSDPGHRLAQSLLKQIKDDPVAMLGATSFAYRVPAGESLSRIAQRFLNDPLQFYILARYNNIKVPRTLGEGQVLRVPGRAPMASATAGPSAAPAPPPAPMVPAAIPAPIPAPPPPPPPVAAPPPATVPVAAPAVEPVESDAARTARLAKQKAEAVARHSRSARTAFAQQDLQSALMGWDAVLALEPDNRTAQLERQRVLSLMDKLGKLPK